MMMIRAFSLLAVVTLSQDVSVSIENMTEFYESSDEHESKESYHCANTHPVES